MSKKTKIIIASVAALLVIVLTVLCFSVFLGKRVTCVECNKKYFEKQGETVSIIGKKYTLCKDCYEKYFGDDDDDNKDTGKTTTTATTTTTGKNDADNPSCDHNNTVTIEEIEATCTEPGHTWSRYCEDCQEILVESEIIPVIDCIESTIKEDKPATKTQDGKVHTECTMCKRTMHEYVIGKGSQGLTYKLNSYGTYTVTDLGDCTDRDVVIPSVYYNIPVTTIGKGAFAYYDTLTSITIPEGVTTIEAEAFKACEMLTSISLPDTLTSIGDCAFYECELLKNISIPNSVTKIGGGLFCNCSSLQTVTLSENITEIKNYKDWVGWYYGMFENCASLKSITLPNSIKSIEQNAFSGCSSLQSISFGENVEIIEDYAFYNCISLSSVTIPDSVISIGVSSFDSCASLRSVIIGSSVVRIDDDAFYGCKLLNNVTMSNSVLRIGCRAFYDCELLTAITFDGEKSQWESIYKDTDWDWNTSNYTVHCIDGNITKEE